MKLAMITAGGAGMFCGSCMQDNTLVRTLRLSGVDALLVPTYTPIRVDEENVSVNRVFLGGINVYLDSSIPGWRRLPGFLTTWLNRPALIQTLARLGSNTDASRLGALTIDMLRGNEGPQRREINELIEYLCTDLRPDVVLFTNALLSGIVPKLRQRFSGTILTLLQGDDIFLEGLTPRYKTEAISLVSQNCSNFDSVLTHSRFYTEFMSTYLSIPVEKFRQIPLTVDNDQTRVGERRSEFSATTDSGVNIGYFARICPEKGIHRLLDAATTLLPQRPEVRITIGGFLPEQNRRRFLSHLQSTQLQVGADRIHWVGSPVSREEKFRLLRSFDVLCVPTEYREPKGLYVLEAALCGITSVLPDHGAFPERVAELGAGYLFSAQTPGDLERVLHHVCDTIRSADGADPEFRQRLCRRVVEAHSMQSTGPRILQTMSELMRQR